MKTVSLILTTYNSSANLIRTLESIENQDYEAVEVNIKDGGSTDGTIDIIRKFARESKYHVNWTSRLDQGIYDAMNQGYQMAGGDVIVFFNDLFLYNQAISEMMQLIDDNPDCVGAHADLVYATDEKIVRYWRMGPQKSIRVGWMPGHPTLFLKREVYDKYGLYHTEFKIAADYEFMVRFLKDKQNRLAYLQKSIIRMYYGGTSTSGVGSYFLSLKEGHRALKINKVRGSCFIDAFRSIRVLLQFVKLR